MKQLTNAEMTNHLKEIYKKAVSRQKEHTAYYKDRMTYAFSDCTIEGFKTQIVLEQIKLDVTIDLLCDIRKRFNLQSFM